MMARRARAGEDTLTRPLVATHVIAGIIAVIAGASAMLSAKGGARHRLGGLVFCFELTVLVATGTALAAIDWPGRWHLFLMGAVAYALAAFGFAARLIRWRGWTSAHIIGMGGAYIAMLTAFYVDNGPRLPLWRLLPPIAFWFVPSIVGLPLVVRALYRHRSHSSHLIAATLIMTGGLTACSDGDSRRQPPNDDECLNVRWFDSMEEARRQIEDWRRDYNESRPHQSLGEQTPGEFALRTKDLEQSIQTAGD
jgi:hypothetical protein